MCRTYPKIQGVSRIGVCMAKLCTLQKAISPIYGYGLNRFSASFSFVSRMNFFQAFTHPML
jgi:hypothetical protein